MMSLVTRENGFLLFDACGSCGSKNFQLHMLVLHGTLGAACQGCWTKLNALINICDDNPTKAKAYWN